MPLKKTENGHENCRFHDDFGKKILMTLVGVLIVYLTFYIATLMRNNLKEYQTIGQIDASERTMVVVGTAKVNAANDMAQITVGFTNIDRDVGKAQDDNSKIMNPIFTELRSLGIMNDDMQSNLSVNPEYDYTENGAVLKGYRVTNNVVVKIRDLIKIGPVLGVAQKYGANKIGSISFTIDDLEKYKQQAREEAIRDAEVKAARIAQLLGVAVGEVVSYNDYETGGDYYRYSAKAMDAAVLSSVPEITSGSQDIMMNVNVTYKIYQ